MGLAPGGMAPYKKTGLPTAEPMFDPLPLTSVLQPLGSRSPRESRLLRWESVLALLVLGVWGFLRWSYIEALLVNPDEPQHLHVTWAWTQGLVQYRDIFDNHTPLFQMLFSPLVGALGERWDILYPMRLAMVPLTLLTLGCVGWLAGRLYSARAGVWSALLVGLSPFYLLVSTEYRTDNLWAVFWMLALVFLFTGHLGRGRSFLAGLLIGAAFCVSMKTSLLLLGLAIGAGLVLGCRLLGGEDIGLGRVLWRNIGFGLLGALVIPLGLLAYFAAHDALGALYYCVVQHNLAPGLKRYGFDRWNFPLLFPLVLVVGWLIYRAAPNSALASRRAILWLAGATTLLLLMSYWPMVTRQDFTAIAPYIGVSLGAGVMAASRWLYLGWTERFHGRFAGFLALVAALALPLGAAAYQVERSLDVWGLDERPLHGFSESLKLRLSITRPEDYVMDAKGETIFRRRPFYYVLEGVTLYRLSQGYTKDTIEEDCRRKNVCMVVMGRMPDSTRPWVERDLVPIEGNLWVAGAFLPEAAGADGVRHFRLARSAWYRFVSPSGTVNGWVDGKPLEGERIYLDAGEHTFVTGATGPMAAVWAQAVETGHTPYNIPPKVANGKKKKKKIPTNPFVKKKRKKDRDGG